MSCLRSSNQSASAQTKDSVKTQNRDQPVSRLASHKQITDHATDQKHLSKDTAKNIFKPLSKRTPIPANILHQVNLRDQRRCTHVNAEGKPCNQSRWTEIHHKIPLSGGGKNTLENLETLCSTHHDWVHSE